MSDLVMKVTNIKRGITFGLIMGALASMWVVISSLVGRLDVSARYDISVGALVAAYLGAGAVGGAAAGLLAFLARWWWGAMFLGFLAALPFFMAVRIYDHGLTGWTDLDGVFAAALILGAPGGLIMRFIIRHVDPFGPLD